MASVKANTELILAMTDSHKAELACMSARIVSMTSVGTPGSVGAAVGFHPTMTLIDSQDVLNERARVASVNILSILKPQTKKNLKAEATP